MIQHDNGEKKVLVLLDKDGRIYQAGDPKSFKAKDIANALKDGDTVNTVTLTEYRKMRWSIIYGYATE